jgi:mono/diheme cytochrome c family protein
MRFKWAGLVIAAVLIAGAGHSGVAQSAPQGQRPAGSPGASPAGNAAAVERGKYLVTAAGCHDCHTPWKMGANGPEPDMTLALSGHPAAMTLPPPPAPSGPWIVASTATNTAWAGPWGVSYTANLTPDPETGLGQWTEQQFVDTIRTGRRQGRGREILPPMPWPAFKNYNDADLKAMFAYLRSIPPMKNKVPDPVLAAPPK